MSFLPSLVLPFLEPADVFVAAGINKNWRQAASLLLRTLDGPAFLQSRRLAASAAVKPKVTKSNVAGAKSKLKKAI
jgi:hypothetical protein